ncbi:MspI family type II restriction endonuclease [Lactobacillus iners]|uniref:MspI family type II restriction endonuclease n=1 Tax=Lactobacillus iners TaxID=147802 RepID=UPI0001FD7E8B|nr:MspI family type II restriction endonuclease [Lactobacillus iners]EGC80195.1 restriction endonuclease MspI [Lactobacillus iners UPII 60-B]MCT7834470.1 MspI family type II restriction endonuclease [Lactobacillus iners]MCT7836390.1 MspI family type II restriction endonuclease [Lactobacillus iners]MCT7882825.1 MspI family type II restriction endonuclease [Lactobacillus iners]MCT7887783.1 MspI family type II restriction endonuclease [Lactobacillus iners]
MESTNEDKAKAGVNTANELLDLLKKIVNKFQKIDLITSVEYGEKDKDKRQFKANAQINFNDTDTSWLVDVSSSFRSDRVKGKEFDIEHIKKILDRQGLDTYAYFILPDNAKEKDKNELEKFSRHIQKQDRVTYFDGAMLMTSFRNLLEHEATKSMDQGIKSNLLGASGEEALALAFTNESNLKIWNNPKSNIYQSSSYSLFEAVIKGLCPNIGKLLSINSIGSNSNTPIADQLKLVKANGQNYGKPKTDVIISIINEKGKNLIFKFSVKQPSSNKGKVTVHEGSVERLLNDLKYSLPSDSIFNDPDMFNKLSTALKDFQKVGSKSKIQDDNLEFLNYHLASLNKWLIDYFMFGINNSYLNKNQQANALLVFDPTTGNCKVSNVSETELTLLNHRKATFNTPFSWTYPSKKRGSKIQIKGPIIL